MADDPEIFDAVMERPLAEREAAVRKACGDDVRRADRLVELVRIATEAELDTAETVSPYLAKGSSFGRYCVVNLLGEGSFGQVYDALDLELDRRVALKVLHEERRSSESDDRRFQQEAKVLARIDHPNVVRVYDAGVECERRFLAMELVQGPSLRTWMREAANLGWSAVLERLLPAARGLAAAHAAGIVHRDFKPENVLIDEARDRVVVADFGIARGHATAELGPPDVSGTGPTPEGFSTESVIGTPAYMAPEQAFGEASPLSDQYAFCRVMEEALGGSIRRAPLPTSSDGQERADPLAHRRIPRALRKALERGTRVEPRERFDDMDALVEALSAVPRNRRWTLTSLLVLAAGLSGAYVLSRPEPPPCAVWSADETREALAPHWVTLEQVPMSAPASAVRAQLRSDVDDGLQRWASARTESCLQRAAGIVDPATAEARDQCFARWRERLERRVRWSAAHPDALESPRFVALAPEGPERCAYVSPVGVSELVLDPEVRAALERSIDEAHGLWVEGWYAESRAVADRALAEARRQGHEPHAADALLQLGILAARAGEPERALDILFEGLEFAQRQGRDDLIFAAELHLAETLLLGGGGDPGRAAPLLVLARAQLARMGKRPALDAELKVLEGHLAQREGDFEGALQVYLEATRRFDALGSVGANGAAAAREHAAEMLSLQGLHEEATAMADRVFASRSEALGRPEHPLLVDVRLRAASIHIRAVEFGGVGDREGHLEAARRYLADGLEQAIRVHGERSGLVAWALTLRGHVALLKEEIDPTVARDVLKLVQLVEALDETTFPLVRRVDALRVARSIHHRLRQWDGALHAATLLIEAHRAAIPPLSPQSRDDELIWISYLMQRGDLDTARQELRIHEVLYAPAFPDDSNYIASLTRIERALDPSRSETDVP